MATFSFLLLMACMASQQVYSAPIENTAMRRSQSLVDYVQTLPISITEKQGIFLVNSYTEIPGQSQGLFQGSYLYNESCIESIGSTAHDCHLSSSSPLICAQELRERIVNWEQNLPLKELAYTGPAGNITNDAGNFTTRLLVPDNEQGKAAFGDYYSNIDMIQLHSWEINLLEGGFLRAETKELIHNHHQMIYDILQNHTSEINKSGELCKNKTCTAEETHSTKSEILTLSTSTIASKYLPTDVIFSYPRIIPLSKEAVRVGGELWQMTTAANARRRTSTTTHSKYTGPDAVKTRHDRPAPSIKTEPKTLAQPSQQPEPTRLFGDYGAWYQHWDDYRTTTIKIHTMKAVERDIIETATVPIISPFTSTPSTFAISSPGSSLEPILPPRTYNPFAPSLSHQPPLHWGHGPVVPNHTLKTLPVPVRRSVSAPISGVATETTTQEKAAERLGFVTVTMTTIRTVVATYGLLDPVSSESTVSAPTQSLPEKAVDLVLTTSGKSVPVAVGAASDTGLSLSTGGLTLSLNSSALSLTLSSHRTGVRHPPPLSLTFSPTPISASSSSPLSSPSPSPLPLLSLTSQPPPITKPTSSSSSILLPITLSTTVPTTTLATAPITASSSSSSSLPYSSSTSSPSTNPATTTTSSSLSPAPAPSPSIPSPTLQSQAHPLYGPPRRNQAGACRIASWLRFYKCHEPDAVAHVAENVAELNSHSDPNAALKGQAQGPSEEAYAKAHNFGFGAVGHCAYACGNGGA